MSTNRVIAYLRCDCCRQRQRDERLQIVVNDLAMLTGDCVSFGHRDGEIAGFVCIDFDETADAENAASHFAVQIRDAADQLTAAAAALEGGAR